MVVGGWNHEILASILKVFVFEQNGLFLSLFVIAISQKLRVCLNEIMFFVIVIS